MMLLNKKTFLSKS